MLPAAAHMIASRRVRPPRATRPAKRIALASRRRARTHRVRRRSSAAERLQRAEAEASARRPPKA
jgi:hypothetical protein